jgi:arsenate reductase
MRVLFVCTGNTCRSPMAERLARQLYPQQHFESAGVIPASGMQPHTAQVLSELGADAAGFSSRSVYALDLSTFTDIVLIGQTAWELAPTPPAGVRMHHWEIDDPYEVSGTEEEQLAAYRACADKLAQCIRALVADVSTVETAT